MLRSIIEGLLAVHEKVEEQQAELDKRVRQAAKTDETTRRLRSNTVPIGAIPTGLQVCECFVVSSTALGRASPALPRREVSWDTEGLAELSESDRPEQVA